MLSFTKLAVASILAALAVASPVPDATVDSIAARDGGLAKRATEGIHMVYCDPPGVGPNSYTILVYCADDSNCNFNPSAANSCRPGTGAIQWTGTRSCTFSTGVTFSWNVQSGAYTAPLYSVVGTGSNGSPWTIRRDDSHFMYNDSQGSTCVSQFYALK